MAKDFVDEKIINGDITPKLIEQKLHQAIKNGNLSGVGLTLLYKNGMSDHFRWFDETNELAPGALANAMQTSSLIVNGVYFDELSDPDSDD